MIANYKQRGIPASAGFIMGMSAKEARAWDLTEAYRMREYDAMATVMIMSMLYYLATNEKDPHGAVRLRQDWEGTVERRRLHPAGYRQKRGGFLHDGGAPKERRQPQAVGGLNPDRSQDGGDHLRAVGASEGR